jgi:uncharacterized protein (TIGR03083 family)
MEREQIDFMSDLEREVAAMQASVEDADLGAPVPTCPGWTVRDLVTHTGIVHRHKTAVVREELTEGPPELPDGPDEDVLAWFGQGIDEMLAVFREADIDAPTWTWCEHEHTVEWWVRRMAHETLIHGADAAIAIGEIPKVDETLAADGIEELLVEMMVGAPEWATLTVDGRTIDIVTPNRNWMLGTVTWSGVSPRGNVYENEPAVVFVNSVGEPDVLITGSAAELDLWLWGRGDLSEGAVRGDAPLVDLLRSIAAEATQ